MPVFLFLPLLYVLVFLYLSRSHYKHAELGIENGIYDPIHIHLIKARELLPLKTAPFLCKVDLQRIHTSLGKVWYEKARKEKINQIDHYAAMEKSLEHYKTALEFGTSDILAVKGIAQTTAELEFVFPNIFPGKENKYNALPLFDQVLKIHPANMESQKTIAKYLYKKGLKEELYAQIQHMAERSPSCYSALKKESFYSPFLASAVKKGLEEAIEKKITLEYAYVSLSILLEDENQFFESAQYLKKAMEFQRIGKTTNNLIKLGFLFLKAEKKRLSAEAFLSGLNKTTTPQKHLDTIYNQFKKQKNYSGFVEFAIFAEVNNFTNDKLQLHVAKAQIAQQLFEPAKETLRSINVAEPNPEAWYLLAIIAQKQKDWDAMELSIQKATVLDPYNGKYFNILANALIYQKKYESAVKYMQEAIKNNPGNQNYKIKLKKIQSKIN